MVKKVEAIVSAEVNKQSFVRAWEQVKKFARDTNKELDQTKLERLSKRGRA